MRALTTFGFWRFLFLVCFFSAVLGFCRDGCRGAGAYTLAWGGGLFALYLGVQLVMWPVRRDAPSPPRQADTNDENVPYLPEAWSD